MNRDAMMVPLTYLIQFAGPIDSKTAEAIASALLDAGLHLEQCGIDYTHCTSKGDETLAPDMSKLNSEQIIKTLEWCIQAPDCENCEYKYEHKHQIDVCSIRSDALALIKELTEKVENYRNELGEVRVALAEANNDKKKLSEENERLRGVGLPDDKTYIKLSDAKHAIMDYIGEQTVSKYASSAECKSARGGAEGAMNEFDYITPAQVAPIADVVPRAIVEQMSNAFENAISAASDSTNAKMHRLRIEIEDLKKYNKCLQVELISQASKIFAEIEEFHKIIYDRYVFDDNNYAEDDVAIECAMNYGTDISNMLCELKKKYIGDKQRKEDESNG